MSIVVRTSNVNASKGMHRPGRFVLIPFTVTRGSPRSSRYCLVDRKMIFHAPRNAAATNARPNETEPPLASALLNAVAMSSRTSRHIGRFRVQSSKRDGGALTTNFWATQGFPRRSKHFSIATFFSSIAYGGDVDGCSFPLQDSSQECRTVFSLRSVGIVYENQRRHRALTARRCGPFSDFQTHSLHRSLSL